MLRDELRERKMEDKAAVGHCTWSSGWWGEVWSWACLNLQFFAFATEVASIQWLLERGVAPAEYSWWTLGRIAQLQRVPCGACKFQSQIHKSLIRSHDSSTASDN